MPKTPRRTLTCAAIALILGTTLPVAKGAEPLPSAEEVFEAYVRGLGGKETLDAIVSVERIGMITNEHDRGRFASGSYHTCIRYPDRIAIEIDAGAWHLAQALRKDGAVECDTGFRSCKRAPADLEKQLADTARYANKDLIEEAEIWRNAVVSLSENGTSWRLTLSDGKGRWAEFDRVEGTLQWLGNTTRARRFGGWHKVEGVSIPLRLEDYAVERSQRAWRSTVQLHEVRIANTPSAWCTDRFGKD